MEDPADQEIVSLLRGLLLSQEVIVEALLSHDTIGFHQLKQSLEEALTALEATEQKIDPAALVPLERLLSLVERLHGPRAPGQTREKANWVAEAIKPPTA